MPFARFASVVLAALLLATPARAAEPMSELPVLLHSEDRALARQRLAAIELRPNINTGLNAPLADPEARALLGWLAALRLRSADAPFADWAAVIAAAPDWPERARLLSYAEARMPADFDGKQRLAWFDQHPPQSGIGRIRYGEALLEHGRTEEGKALIRAGWRNAWIGRDEEVALRKAHPGLLTEADHIDRFNWMMAAKAYDQAARLQPLLSPARRIWAVARLSLKRDAADVEARVRAVPAQLRADPEFVVDRIGWRRRHKLDAGVLELLAQPGDVMTLVQPAQAWLERHLMIRTRLKAHDPATAYRLASSHGLVVGKDSDRKLVQAYAEAEWLAGWIALRFLGDPRQAQRHFERLYDQVATPISRSRAAYWRGRTAAVLGDPLAMLHWYGVAAKMPQRFYGRLAAEELGQKTGLGEAPPVLISAVHRQAFFARDDVKAALLLHEMNDGRELGRFARYLATRLDDGVDRALAIEFARALARPDIGLAIAKAAEDETQFHLAYGYPVIEMPAGLAGLPALAHAIIRQESAFDVGARSSAGARGLMQLMPQTARASAVRLGLAYSEQRLVADGAYNMRLASGHVEQLDRDYGGALVLMVAAYNAGSRPVNAWVRDYGDPRAAKVDVIDWIEQIPYGETRNYVQRVLESMAVYAERMGDSGALFRLGAALKREGPG